MKLTPKERLLLTLRCEQTGSVPISPLGINEFEIDRNNPAYTHFKPILKALDKHGTPFVRSWFWTPPLLIDPKSCGLKTETRKEGVIEYSRISMQTPKGELYSLGKKDPRVSNSPAQEKAFNENEEDLDKALSLATLPTYLPDMSETRALQERIGDNGLVCMHSISSPHNLTAGLCNYEFYLMYAISAGEGMRRICETNLRRLKEMLSYLIDQGAGPVFRLHNIEGYTTPMLPPDWASQWIVPYDKELVSMIHQAGCYADNHCHGRLRDQVNNFLEIGVDCINCVEPPPANDIDLAELKEKTGGKICFYGYIQMEDLERCTSVEIRKLTREALAMSGGRGFILSPAATYYTSEISKTFSDNLIAMIEEGSAYNRE